jgi:uncharacterized protein (UPF0332 family)
MTENTRILVNYRLEQAVESLEAAKVLLEKGLLRPSVNRSYYAMFYAVLALLTVKRKETSKHTGRGLGSFGCVGSGRRISPGESFQPLAPIG